MIQRHEQPNHEQPNHEQPNHEQRGPHDDSGRAAARRTAGARVLQLPLAAVPVSPAPAPAPAGPAAPLGAAARPYRPHGDPEDVHPVLRRAGAPPAALALLAQAEEGLAEARAEQGPLERYAAAHLAGLRAAAAVLAVRGRPEADPRKRRRIRSAWEVLPEVAPELAEWAVYYAAGASKRAAAEAGLPSAATRREADDLIRNTALFLRLVRRLTALDPPARPNPADRPTDRPAPHRRTG